MQMLKRKSIQEIFRTKKVFWWEHVIVLLLGVAVILGILYRAGTLHSGYHFMDDHELIRMELSFENGASLWSQIKGNVLNDLSWRFRPFYWVERVTGAYFMGSDLYYWNIYTAVKGILTFWLLYCTARFLRYGRTVSVIFPMVIMLGEQFTPWYRSANQESTGLLLCAFTLCMIAAQYDSGKFRSIAYNVCIVLGAVLCGLVKESFTLFMPVFPALKLWLEYWDGGRSKEKKPHSALGGVFHLLKENAAVYVLIAGAMLFNVYMILFQVGVDKVSYAGFQEGTPLSEYLSGIYASLFYYTKWFTYFGILVLLMTAMCYQLIEKREVWKYLGGCAIGGYVLVVQLIAHAESGMWERYILPYSVGYAFLFLLLGFRVFEKDVIRRRIFLGVWAVLLCLEIPLAYNKARDYAYTGQMVKVYFQCILDNTTEEEQIISAFSDGELNLATECWLEVRDRTQVYSYSDGAWDNKVQLAGAVTEEYAWENAKVVTCYGRDMESILAQIGDNAAERYDIHGFGEYSVLVKKD